VILADMERKNRGSFWEAVYHREFGPIMLPPKFGADEPKHLALEMHKYVEDREDDEESLRILYVALTRAADHLILSAGLPADPALAGSRVVRSQWMRLLADHYDLGTGLAKGDPYFDSLAGNQRTSGPAASRVRSNLEIGVHRSAPDLTVVPRLDAKMAKLSQWRELVEGAEPGPLPPLLAEVVPTRSGPLSLSVSRIEEADAKLRSEKPPRPRRRAKGQVDEEAAPLIGEAAALVGSLVHRVIERLPRASKIDPETIEAGVRSVLKGLPSASIPAIDPAILVRRVQALVESDLWDEMREAQRCFREIEFLLVWPVGAAPSERIAVIAGTLDCLLLSSSGQWKVLDYKTGRVPGGDPAALRDHFAIQLVLYAEAVRAMVGRPPAAIEIVSLQDNLTRFPLVIWDEFRGAVQERIDAAIRHLATALDLNGGRLADQIPS
jgi:ATP-dependent helicase/nuclease subunit A